MLKAQSLQQGEWSGKLTQMCIHSGQLVDYGSCNTWIICDSKFSYLSCRELFMFSLSLAIIGFVTSIEVISNNKSGLKPEKKGMARGTVIFSTVFSGLLILGICILLIT